MMRITAVTVLSLVVTAAAVGSRERASAPLSAVDYYEIETLYGRSLHDLGTGAESGRAFARSFVPTATLVSPSGRVTGRREIGEQSLAGRGRRYWLTNLLIEPTTDGVTGWAYVAQSQGATFLEGGLYEDDLVKTNEGWRVKARTYKPGTQWTRQSLPGLTKNGNVGTGLTATDYAEIKHLVYRYNVGYDNAGPFDQGLLSLQPFSDDVVFDRINGPTYRGKEIAGQSAGHKPLLHHWDSNFLISVAPDGEVSGFNYDMQFNVESPGAPVLLGGGGLLHHRFVKTPDGWRIKYRRYEAVGSTPQINWPMPEAVPFTSKIAPERPSRGVRLTGADRAQIEQLYVLNNVAFDSAADGGRRYAETFTPDGVLVRGSQRLAGAAALAATAAANTPGLHHWVSNVTVEPSKQGATGRAYVLGAAIAGEPGVKQTQLKEMGLFDDVLVKTPRGWRFARRTVTPTPLAAAPAAEK